MKEMILTVGSLLTFVFAMDSAIAIESTILVEQNYSVLKTTEPSFESVSGVRFDTFSIDSENTFENLSK